MGICDDDEIGGCMDKDNACNFDRSATDNDGSCIYPIAHRDCLAKCLADDDGDNVCDQDEVVGCQNTDACNFGEHYTDHLESSCTFAPPYYNCDGCLNDADNDGVCDELEISGCQDETACNFDSSATDPPRTGDGCTYAEDKKNCDGSCRDGFLKDCSDEDCCPQSWLGADYKDCKDQRFGCDLSCYNYDNGGCIKHGCNRINACNYDEMVTHQNSSSCIWPEPHMDCWGNCLADTNNNGVCDPLEFGCKDQDACNYNDIAIEHVQGDCAYPSVANLDCDGNCLNDMDGDGVCDEDEILGCTEMTACNYQPAATDNNGACQFAEQYKDCNGDCLNDDD